MIAFIALCDRQGIVNRLIKDTAEGQIAERQNIRHLFQDEEKLENLLKQAPDHGRSIRLRMKRDGNAAEVNVTVKPIDDLLLFMAYDIAEAAELPQLIEISLSVLDTQEMFSTGYYGSGYYEIQKLNNQMVNYQRTLDKTNRRLQNLLQETQEAKFAIEVLERDTITTLYTEKAFCDRAISIILKNDHTEFDIIAADIVHFKVVNDIFGSEKGDRLLMDLATCLLGIQTGDKFLFSRARADTFFILLPRQESNYTTLKQSIDSFLENYLLPMRLQIKFGIYKIDNKNMEVSRMCDRALMAIKSIKGDYNKKFAFYSDSMHEQLMKEQKISNTMEDSLQRELFRVYLQPKVNIFTGGIIGAEALVRWFHPEMGMIPPRDFIPLFEKNGFIHSLNFYVWEKTCEMMRNWKLTNKRAIPISVNVSRADLYYENLPEIFTDLVEKYQLKPEELHLEITESAYVDDSKQIVNVIKRLRNKGFIIAMDDFGSGYSSLNALSELPIDIVKMDLEFLAQGENMDRKQKIIRLVIELAKELQLQVLAEGVETERQALLLKSMGCQHAQGYLYGPPMPENDFLSKHEKMLAC